MDIGCWIVFQFRQVCINKLFHFSSIKLAHPQEIQFIARWWHFFILFRESFWFDDLLEILGQLLHLCLLRFIMYNIEHSIQNIFGLNRFGKDSGFLHMPKCFLHVVVNCLMFIHLLCSHHFKGSQNFFIALRHVYLHLGAAP